MNKKSVLLFTLLGLLLFTIFCSCSRESDTLLRQKLELILPDDIDGIVKDVPKDALLEKPYYSITSFKVFKKGMYIAKAEVDFYFFNKLRVKIVRKFRYHRSSRLWERYHNEYQHLPDSLPIQEK
jgi:hypothetical protein